MKIEKLKLFSVAVFTWSQRHFYDIDRILFALLILENCPMILSVYQYMYNLRTGNRFTMVLYIGQDSGDCPYDPAVESSGPACVTVRERVCLHISCSFHSNRPRYVVKPRSRNRTGPGRAKAI